MKVTEVRSWDSLLGEISIPEKQGDGKAVQLGTRLLAICRSSIVLSFDQSSTPCEFDSLFGRLFRLYFLSVVAWLLCFLEKAVVAFLMVRAIYFDYHSLEVSYSLA